MHPELIMEIESVYMVFCQKQDIFAALGRLTMERYPSYCPSGSGSG